MSYTETVEGINMDVQAPHITISSKLQQNITKMVVRLRRHFYELKWIDISFTKKSEYSAANRKISVRLGIPDNNAFASDSGDNWVALLKSVEGKLRRQLQNK